MLSTTQSDSMLKAQLDLQLAELRLKIYDKHQANQLNAQSEKGSQMSIKAANEGRCPVCTLKPPCNHSSGGSASKAKRKSVMATESSVKEFSVTLSPVKYKSKFQVPLPEI